MGHPVHELFIGWKSQQQNPQNPQNIQIQHINMLDKFNHFKPTLTNYVILLLGSIPVPYHQTLPVWVDHTHYEKNKYNQGSEGLRMYTI